MIERRTFLKGIVALPLLLGINKNEEKICAKQKIITEVNPYSPVVHQFWHNQWWKAEFNKIEWTDPRGIWLERPSNVDFVHWNILDNNFDCCEVLWPHQDVLLWFGKREIWEITPWNYGDPFDLEYKFQYLGSKKEFLNFMRSA